MTVHELANQRKYNISVWKTSNMINKKNNKK